MTRDEILRGFERYFTHDESMEQIAASLRIDTRTLRREIRKEFQRKSIVIRTPENHKLNADLGNQWRGCRYHVLDAEDDSLFYRGAGEVFFEEFSQLLDALQGRDTLRIGVVSGRTTGGMIEVICDSSTHWKEYLRSDSIPRTVYVYALNVSQTSGFNELKGNSNILAYLLAKKLKEEFPDRMIQAFGLSTELLQTEHDARKSDIRPLTSEVLRYTDPQRLRRSWEKEEKEGKAGKDCPVPKDAQSALDLVITGVGSVKDSLFREYCQQNGIELVQLEQDGAVGDISYTLVTRLGEKIPLRRGDQEYEFFTAVSLEVLHALSSSNDRKVLLVARNLVGSSNKVNPIHAAICGPRRYCNVLITDTATARALETKFGR